MTIDRIVAQTSLRQETQHSPARALWSLTRDNLYLARRRVMSKVLLAILLGLFALIVGFFVIEYNAVAGAPASTFNTCPPRAAQCPQPTDAQLEAVRQEALDGIRAFLTFPTSVGVAGGYTGFVGALLIAILAGTLVGSEYGQGTLRLSLTRGLGRVQVLAGQVIALAVLALGTGIGMLLVGTLSGVTIGPSVGGKIPDLTAEGVRELVVYGLAVSLQLFVYALFALAFATLGRSAAAGIGGAIGVLFLELVASPIFQGIGAALGGDWGSRLQHTPDFFPSNNLSALITRASEAPIRLNRVDPTTLDLTHAALVVAAFVVVLIVGSYALFRVRDVTD
jgi:ABC-type transport system involved in multi-copper enzyme maturation permease subunit